MGSWCEYQLPIAYFSSSFEVTCNSDDSCVSPIIKKTGDDNRRLFFDRVNNG